MKEHGLRATVQDFLTKPDCGNSCNGRPDATVEHNVKLPGRHSKRDPQIDVLVRQQIGQHQMIIVLGCKDYAEPVDVKGVEEFHGLSMTSAHKGALVSPKGFTKAAKERAAGMQIHL